MKTIESLGPLFPWYEGIVVPRQYFHEFLGALTTAASLQGIKQSRIAWSAFPAAEKYRELEKEIHVPVRASQAAVEYQEGRRIVMDNERLDLTMAKTMHFSPLDAWCVEAGLLTQASRLRSYVDDQPNPHWVYNDISLTQATHKERLSELVADAVHDSAYHRVSLPESLYPPAM